jgi:pimeloyl-ACP methyl ester carboxylesterase
MPSFKLSFLLLIITATLFYFGWKRWLVVSPQPLPQTSTIAAAGDLLKGQYYETSVPPTADAKYLSAEYQLWIPDQVQTLRGLLVRQHGCGDLAAGTGLDHAKDLQWQALAAKHQFALLGTQILMGDRHCDDWAYIDRGSGEAFMKAINDLAQKSQHPELETIPWAMWGHSGGADWAAQMLQKYPDRTIGAVAVRCGAVTFPEKADPKMMGVPFLLAIAQKEDAVVDECRDLPKRVFAQYRKAGALWALAEEANGTHDVGDSRLLAIPYLDALITARLPINGTTLRAIDISQGWLGNLASGEITPANQDQGDALAAAWLPNEETARKWQQYVTTGKISPTQKPAAPTDVQVARTGAGTIVLTWHFAPDLENGLPSFRVYRNNRLIRTFRGQQHNFGDAPEQTQLFLELQDEQANPNSNYKVAAFNTLGESDAQAVAQIDRQ